MDALEAVASRAAPNDLPDPETKYAPHFVSGSEEEFTPFSLDLLLVWPPFV